MNRTALINFLIRQRNGKRYLEIGFIEEDLNFDGIHCIVKEAVANNPGKDFHVNSNVYFEQVKEKFDLIFIDGYHTEGQVSRDLQNAFKCLAPDGLIVLHDCMPPDEWHQREPSAFKEKENWNGTVWKAALRAFNSSPFKCTLLDTDWGCGIIDTAATQVPIRLDLPKLLNYGQHYPLLQKYKTSVGAYLQQQVKVFYHLACMGNWKEVFTEQFILLKDYNFLWIDCTVLGTAEDLQFVYSFFEEIQINATVIFISPELALFEKPAFIAMQEYANQYDGYVLYLHSKGVSNPADTTKAKWRRLMMHELVVNWQNCISQLPQYDAIGVNWREMPPVSHFCGNFWYASTQYLRKLPDFNKYYDNPRYRISDQINSKRLGCEFWIGSYAVKPKILSLAYRNVDFCNAGFWNDKFISGYEKKNLSIASVV